MNKDNNGLHNQPVYDVESYNDSMNNDNNGLHS